MPRDLAALLLEEGAVSAEALSRALERQRGAGGALDTALLEEGALPEDALLGCLARAAELPAAPAHAWDGSDQRARRVFPSRVAERHGLAPFALEGRELSLVATYPVDLGLVDEISFMLSLHLTPHVGPEWRVRELIHRLYGSGLPPRLAALAAAAAGKPVASAPPPPEETAPAPEPPPAAPAGFGEEAGQLEPLAAALQQAIDETEPPADEAPAPAGAAGPEPEPEAPRERDDAGEEPEADAERAPPDRTFPPRWTLDDARAALAAARDRDEVVLVALRYARDFLEYAAVFAVTRDAVAGHDALGAEDERERARAVAIWATDPGILKTVIETRSPYLGPVTRDAAGTETILSGLGRGVPRTVLLYPVLLRDRTVCVLYADNGEAPVSPRRLGDLLLFLSGLGAAFERIIRRRKGAGDARERLPAAPPAERAAEPEPEPAAEREDAPAEHREPAWSEPRQEAPEAEAPEPQVEAQHEPEPEPEPQAPPEPAGAAEPEPLRRGAAAAGPTEAEPFDPLSPPRFEPIAPDRGAEPPQAEEAGAAPDAGTAEEGEERGSALEASPEEGPAAAGGPQPEPWSVPQRGEPSAPDAGAGPFAHGRPEPAPPTASAAPGEPRPAGPSEGSEAMSAMEAALAAIEVDVDLGDEPADAPQPPAPAAGAPPPAPRSFSAIEEAFFSSDGGRGAAGAPPASPGTAWPPQGVPPFPLSGAFAASEGPRTAEPDPLPAATDPLPAAPEPPRAAAPPSAPVAQEPFPAAAEPLASAAPAPLPAEPAPAPPTAAAPTPAPLRAAPPAAPAPASPTALADRALDADEGVAAGAREALAAQRRDAALRPANEKLRRALLSGISGRTARAARAIGAIRDVEAIPLLIQVLETSEPETATAAADALALITLQRLGPDARRWLGWWKENRGRGRAEWLFSGLTSPDRETRLAAVAELTLAAPPPVEFSADAPPEERERLARAWAGWWARSGHVL